ncbi:hydrophobic/amphiphilic exporter-1, HAE1 family [Pelosinus fermentans]|uniref:efflux RND transporter permease subunit n=1 Tax=Pelosinus fermentans TaxID=365349 RepID=UPI0002686307|nr:efflux RND transporter permease subunit [Pelosinus fermentans]OAM94294.1 acriflavin resistance protein [Pelosinus fermentans DSM 17108]SDR05404.1 hydrophobic/amphiphilic exporter-1, HAE1 family [Pelosinus fermentans]
MIGTFIKRPVFTTMIVMLLVVFGLGAYPSLGIDLNPDVEYPIVNVTITYTGASPEEIESLITKPIEDAVSSVSGIKSLSSVSREGASQVTLEFEFGTNPKLAANEVREKVAGVRKRLPDQIDEPVVQRFDITAQSIVYFSLASDTRSRGEIRKLAIDVVKDELQRMDGVAQVDVFGATDREIQIYIDPKKIESYDISFQQIHDAINDQNLNTPGGKVNEKGTELTVRTMGKYKSIDDIKNTIVANQQGRLIPLKDVVTIEDGWAEERVYARTNGTPSVIIAVQKQSGTNTVDVAERVIKSMEHIKTNLLPPDIKVSIVRDSSKYIRSSVEDVMVSLIFGGFLAVVITFLFLQNTRATLIGAIAIPTSIIATFFALKVMGFTLNNMSLMGLSLAVGILIDDAIVVIENIFRHMEEGLSPMDAAKLGTNEISLAVVATTLSILAVFVPVGNMGEIIGQFFKQFGITVAFAVAFSLFVAFTLTPTLAAYWLKNDHGEHQKLRGNWTWLQKILDKWEEGFLALRDNYRFILQWSLKRPKKLVAFAILSLFLNALLLPFIGVEFQPTYDSGEFNVILTATSGTSMDKMKELVEPIEKQVLAIPELESAFVLIGANRQVNKVSIGVRLVDSDKRSRSMSQIMDQLRVVFRNVKNLKVAVQSNQGLGRGDSRPVQIGLRGPELEVLNRSAYDLAEAIKEIPGTTDVDISSDQSEPEVQIKLDAVKAAETGIDSTIAGDVIQIAFLGKTTKNQYNVADSDYDIRVQLQPASRLSIQDVSNLRISSKTGTFVRLGDIADVKFSSGPTQIDRESRQRQVIVYANTVGASTGEVLNKVKELIPDLNLPLGYTYKFVGQAQMMQDSFKEIGKALLLAVILIYMVLAAEFESFVHPLTIMLSLPFSLVGAILGLLVSGKTINMMSLIGVIMLMGLVTKNAILLIDNTIHLQKNGMSIMDALVEAGVLRLRPILMTTMAMIFGMMPVALGLGAGAELRSSMGVVLIGGLITSTFLTLIIVPLVYFLIDEIQQSSKRRKLGKVLNS